MIPQSCLDAIDEVFDSKLHIIGGVGISIGIVMVRPGRDLPALSVCLSVTVGASLTDASPPPQMFGMIFSMLLCCAIRKSREVV